MSRVTVPEVFSADDAAPAETVTGAAEGAPEATKAPEAAVTGAAEGASKAASPAAEVR